MAPPSGSPQETTRVTSNNPPTDESATTSPNRSTVSLAQHLKDCVRDGATKLAQGNVIHWTPEELAQMTPEQRARCVPSQK